jgi:magnesium chelatase family protein
MLARRFPSIMPPLTPVEAVEVTRLHSLAGQIKTCDPVGGLITQPPFRSPHHSASTEGVLGGGRIVRPGEITLAHFGTLFLDEAPEFRTPVLQSLREPLEDRVITIVRAEGPLALPADFQLLLAANGCPCGRLGAAFPCGTAEPAAEPREGRGSPPEGDEHAIPADSGCFCTPDEIRRYWRKLGSALLDRIELRVPLNAPGILSPGGSAEERSAVIRKRVIAAAAIQEERFRGSGIRRNSRMGPGLIEKFCPLARKAGEVFNAAAAKLCLSGRACHAILKTARTIADLEGKDVIDSVHILEAIQHRRFGDDPYDIFSA